MDGRICIASHLCKMNHHWLIIGFATLFINSSCPSAAYMHHWIGSALIKIMGCAYWVSSTYLNQCWVIVNWTLREVNFFYQNTQLFIHEKSVYKLMWYWGFNARRITTQLMDGSYQSCVKPPGLFIYEIGMCLSSSLMVDQINHWSVSFEDRYKS